MFVCLTARMWVRLAVCWCELLVGILVRYIVCVIVCSLEVLVVVSFSRSLVCLFERSLVCSLVRLFSCVCVCVLTRFAVRLGIYQPVSLLVGLRVRSLIRLLLS